jgi:hypothetical protein
MVVDCSSRSPRSSFIPNAVQASPTPAVVSTLASVRSGRSWRTRTAPSSGSLTLRHGLLCRMSEGGPPGERPAVSSAPEGIAMRKPSWPPLTGVLPTFAANRSMRLRPLLLADTARLSWRTLMSLRWRGAWAGARSAGPSTRPESAWSAPPWPTRSGGREGNSSWPIAGLPPPGSTTDAAATMHGSDWRIGSGSALAAADGWTATPMRPLIFVTGPDRSSTGMSSGVELLPRCRSWATTTGRLALQVRACEAL